MSTLFFTVHSALNTCYSPHVSMTFQFSTSAIRWLA